MSKTKGNELTIADYEEAFASQRRLVRELDVLLNGEDFAARQASLVDIIIQLENGACKTEVKTMWVIKLRPAFHGHPPFPPTYYAGYLNDNGNAAMTTNIDETPKFANRQTARQVAGKLLPTLSCVWQVAQRRKPNLPERSVEAARTAWKNGYSEGFEQAKNIFIGKP